MASVLFNETRLGTYQPIFTSSANREYQGDSDGVGRGIIGSNSSTHRKMKIVAYDCFTSLIAHISATSHRGNQGRVPDLE